MKNLILENFAEINEQTKQKYIETINQNYNGLLEKYIANPNGFVFLLPHDIEYSRLGQPNKCEQNTFEYTKRYLEKNLIVYPVGGFMFFGNTLHPIEHYWAYNPRKDQFIDVTPVKDVHQIKCYIGVVNKNINEQILKTEKYFDVPFFKGGYVESNYF